MPGPSGNGLFRKVASMKRVSWFLFCAMACTVAVSAGCGGPKVQSPTSKITSTQEAEKAKMELPKPPDVPK